MGAVSQSDDHQSKAVGFKRNNSTSPQPDNALSPKHGNNLKPVSIVTPLNNEFANEQAQQSQHMPFGATFGSFVDPTLDLNELLKIKPMSGSTGFGVGVASAFPDLYLASNTHPGAPASISPHHLSVNVNLGAQQQNNLYQTQFFDTAPFGAGDALPPFNMLSGGQFHDSFMNLAASSGAGVKKSSSSSHINDSMPKAGASNPIGFERKTLQQQQANQRLLANNSPANINQPLECPRLSNINENVLRNSNFNFYNMPNTDLINNNNSKPFDGYFSIDHQLAHERNSSNSSVVPSPSLSVTPVTSSSSSNSSSSNSANFNLNQNLNMNTGAFRNPHAHLQPQQMHQFDSWNGPSSATNPTQHPQLSMYNFNALQLNAHLNPTLQSNPMFINQTTASQFNSLLSNGLQFENLNSLSRTLPLAQRQPSQSALSDFLSMNMPNN